jgi:hypothetical protein
MKNGLMPKLLTYTNFTLIYYLEIQIYGSLYIRILSFRSDFLWTCHFEYDWMTLCNYYTLCSSYQKDENLGYEHAPRNASLLSYQNTVEALPIMVEHLVMCDSISKMFVYTKTSTSYWFTSHKIHSTRQFAGFTCLCFIGNVWKTHLCHGCRPQCVLVSTPLYAQNILSALSTASWHTTMQSLHSQRLSTLNTEDEYTRDTTNVLYALNPLVDSIFNYPTYTCWTVSLSSMLCTLILFPFQIFYQTHFFQIIQTHILIN